MPNITLLYGAIRDGRLSFRAAIAVQKALEAAGAQVRYIDIKAFGLPVMEARLKDQTDPAPSLTEIGESLKHADGIVFVSPEYNNSYAGSFKNAVDYFTTEWARKPIGVVAASAGKMGGINASNLMQLLVLAIGGYAMPTKLLVPELATSLDDAGIPQNEVLARQIDRFAQEMVWFTEAIAARKTGDQK